MVGLARSLKAPWFYLVVLVQRVTVKQKKEVKIQFLDFLLFFNLSSINNKIFISLSRKLVLSVWFPIDSWDEIVVVWFVSACSALAKQLTCVGERKIKCFRN